MYSLLAYGSLMNPDELARQSLEDAAFAPVRVRGFRRSFCQEPSWRPAAAGRRAVLTVRPAPGQWINAVRIDHLATDTVAELDHRERGYIRTTVPTVQIECYRPEDCARPAGETVLYLGRAEKFNSQILPGDAYLQLCLAGAAAWGPDFLRDFLKSTFVQDQEPLAEYGSYGVGELMP